MLIASSAKPGALDKIMAEFRIFLFRNFECTYRSRVVSGLGALKMQELLSYLLLHRDRPHSRELVAGTLWQNSSLGQTKKNLRQVIWQIHTAMQHVDGADALLQTDTDHIQINPDAIFRLDIAEFDDMFEETKSIRGRDLDSEHLEILRRAVKLYRGQLLEGWYHDWCIYERERLHDIYLSMLDKLLGYSEVHNDYNTGMTYGSMILHSDPARERTHRRLMRLQYATGRRTEAIRQFQACTEALHDDLGVTPGRRTTLLHEQIRDSQPVSKLVHVDLPARQQRGNAIDDAGARLDQIETTLTTLQDQVEQLRELLRNTRS